MIPIKALTKIVAETLETVAQAGECDELGACSAIMDAIEQYREAHRTVKKCVGVHMMPRRGT